MMIDDAQKSANRAAPPVPDKDSLPDNPPSYSQSTQGASFFHPHSPSQHGRFPSSPAAPTASPHATNHLTFKTRKEPISGSFQIDPGMEVHNPQLEKLRGRKRKARGKKGIKWPWSSAAPEEDVPNAVFETRQGDVAVNLSAVASSAVAPGTAPRRAVVDISTRQGNVDVAIFQIDPGRHMNLKVETRQGHIHVFVPRRFSGPIHLRSAKGSIVFLKRLAQDARVISSRDQEAMVLIGASAMPTAKETPSDYLSLFSRTGEIVVGYYGEDELPRHEGFWKKLGNWLSGSGTGTQ
ncbi:hypothetical protein AURDEDRAFT_186675 [Auricularia subglabra TFB-10046 SS5]|nr:hypothetical protein AURDEDRAFT_186675 [Auricularia subglabra TFB-10046 SS5]